MGWLSGHLQPSLAGAEPLCCPEGALGAPLGWETPWRLHVPIALTHLDPLETLGRAGLQQRGWLLGTRWLALPVALCPLLAVPTAPWHSQGAVSWVPALPSCGEMLFHRLLLAQLGMTLDEAEP